MYHDSLYPHTKILILLVYSMCYTEACVEVTFMSHSTHSWGLTGFPRKKNFNLTCLCFSCWENPLEEPHVWCRRAVGHSQRCFKPAPMHGLSQYLNRPRKACNVCGTPPIVLEVVKCVPDLQKTQPKITFCDRTVLETE